ncbi:MAG: SIMPL domain-containing protein, partial [Candidatus Helarchaeota archaeon]|nr:SIMPL domain-containing protein [Candidatus Helarchaeota archaeon]
YSWEKDSRVLKGYYSECLVDLYVKDMSKISEVYKKLANYQNITIQETDYKRNDEFEIRKIEFEKALLAAKKKADYMAQTLDTKIGKVYSIQELSADNFFAISTYSNVLKEREVSDSKSGYGNIKITALVLVEFELE